MQPTVKLLDREREIDAIDSLLARARHDEGSSVVLRGQVGIGLSALLDYAVHAAEEAGMVVLRADGIEAELQVPFAALHRLLAGELERPNRLPEPQQRALDRAFGLQPSAEPEPANFLVVGLAVLNLLAGAGSRQPLLCVVDDAQFLDSQSAVALGLAARRLGADPVAIIFAETDSGHAGDRLLGIDTIRVRGLPDASARELIDLAFGPKLDPNVRERVLNETAGNPLAILELSTVPGDGAALAEPLPLPQRLEDHFVDRASRLSPAAQGVLLLAAALYDGSAALYWRAAGRLDIPAEATREAEAAGLLTVDTRVTLLSSLLRSAVYGAATGEERRRAHGALGAAAEEESDPVRAAWHLAAASPGPDEAIAAALASAAESIAGREDAATGAQLFERAAGLTLDRALRAGWLLEAVRLRLSAGAPGRASVLLGELEALPLTELEQALATKLRAQVAHGLGDVGESAALLLSAAERIVVHDERQGRLALLEALEAAIYFERFGSGGQVLRAARTALPYASGTSKEAGDLLLNGLALLFTSGHADAVPVLVKAQAALEVGEDARWLTIGGLTALELWDESAVERLLAVSKRLASRSAFGVTDLSLAYLEGLGHVVAGQFTRAAERYGDVRVLADTARDPAIAGIADAGSLLVAAWRGRESEARLLIDRGGREAMAAELGRYYSLTRYALAVLANALGQYDVALRAAQEAVEERSLYLATFALPEVVEAAVRIGATETAAAAVEELALRTIPSGTDWGLGMLARSRALVTPGDDAQGLYGEAIERLSRSRCVPQLARAHLVFGEWLRRRRRRREAREQLRRAEGMFVAMSAEAFAARARGELRATGESISPPAGEPAQALTAQEARIARMVVEGLTNQETGAQMFISTRTVEYHLHKIYRKLGITSRVELAHVFLAGEQETRDELDD